MLALSLAAALSLAFLEKAAHARRSVKSVPMGPLIKMRQGRLLASNGPKVGHHDNTQYGFCSDSLGRTIS